MFFWEANRVGWLITLRLSAFVIYILSPIDPQNSINDLAATSTIPS